MSVWGILMLRNQVLKLAHDHPELRRHLIPLLRQAADETLDSAAPKNPRVRDKAKVSDDAWVSDDAEVFDNAEVSGRARVSGDCRISGTAKIRGGFWDGAIEVTEGTWDGPGKRVKD